MITVDTKTEPGLIGTSPPRLDAWEKVTGKVLTSEDQKRLQEEASRQIAS